MEYLVVTYSEDGKAHYDLVNSEEVFLRIGSNIESETKFIVFSVKCILDRS